MDAARLSKYPFLTQAAQYVADMDTPLDHILTFRSFDMTRSRSRTRVQQAVKGEIQHDDTIDNTVELLSYPVARILVSCINDAFLTRRYALSEAKFAYGMMKQEDNDILAKIGQDFNIKSGVTESGFTIHFTDYIRVAAGMRALPWKLVNRRLKSGYVNITKEEFARLLQEAIRARILATLPLEVPDGLCRALEEYIAIIQADLEITKTEFDDVGFGDVEPEHFPPCIIHLLSSVRGGMNLAHTARFGLTSFLLNIGMSVDKVIHLFNISPDFNEEKTRYQVDHIAGGLGTPYKSPSCSTMITYGNCYGKDELCRTINHPLSYYKRKKDKKR